MTFLYKLSASLILFIFTLSAPAGAESADTPAAGYAAVGAYHSLVIDVSGVLWVFGDNSQGQLGIGSEPGAISPRPLLSNVRTAEAGPFASFVISTDGTLWAFGKNSRWELGLASYGNRHIPAPVLSRAAAVSASAGHTLGLDEDGNIWAWGDNRAGQLGIGATDGLSSPRKVLGGASQALARPDFSLAVGRGYTLWGWGNLEMPLTGSGGRSYSDSNTIFATPQPIFSHVLKVSAGSRHYLALRQDDSLWSWGDNSEGQVGDGSRETRLSPVKLLEDIVEIAAGPRHSLALDRQGRLWGWGSNHAGQLGLNNPDGENGQAVRPAVLLTEVVQIFPADTYTLALDKQNRLWFTGLLAPPEFPEFKGIYSPVPEIILEDAAFAAPGAGHMLFIKTDGSLWGLGNNTSGQLGLPALDFFDAPAEIALKEQKVEFFH